MSGVLQGPLRDVMRVGTSELGSRTEGGCFQKVERGDRAGAKDAGPSKGTQGSKQRQQRIKQRTSSTCLGTNNKSGVSGATRVG